MVYKQCSENKISIHALREESDHHIRPSLHTFRYFNPRSP